MWNKIWKMEHCGNELFVDEQGLRKYYFDILVGDLYGHECSCVDSIEWLDDTRDLDSQLDFIKFAKYGDIEDIIKNLIAYENADIKEINTYKDLLKFYVDYLSGNITDYCLYNEENYGVPHEELIKNMLDNLNDIAINNRMSEFEILNAWIDTKAWDVEDFEETLIMLIKNNAQYFVETLENIYIELHGKVSNETLDKIEEIAWFLDKLGENIDK